MFNALLKLTFFVLFLTLVYGWRNTVKIIFQVENTISVFQLQNFMFNSMSQSAVLRKWNSDIFGTSKVCVKHKSSSQFNLILKHQNSRVQQRLLLNLLFSTQRPSVSWFNSAVFNYELNSAGKRLFRIRNKGLWCSR